MKEGTITPQPTRAGWIYYKLNPPLKKGEKEMKTEAAQAKQEKQSINNFIHLVLEEALKEKEQ